jgi:dsRNA-specific ribonuclease
LFESHPEWSEAQMTLYKIALVREEMLAQVAREIRLADHIFISHGEEGQ